MVDINLKIPAIEKLVDVVASGIGAIGGPMLARWKARANADAMRIEAQGKADALSLIADAQKKASENFAPNSDVIQGRLDINKEIQVRLSFQEEKRQRNIESVIGMAAEELKEKEVHDHTVDHDWVARFFADVQDVSSDEMQQIWAKILSGEVETPGRTSLQTLSILKNMTQKDAEMFSEIAKFTIHDFIVNESVDNIPEYPSHDNFFHLSSYNLINTDFGLHQSLKGKDRYYFYDKDVVYSVFKNKNEIYEVDIPCYILSSAGKELYSFIECKKNIDYLRGVANFLKRKGGGILEYAPILYQDESKFRPGAWTRVEPSNVP